MHHLVDLAGAGASRSAEETIQRALAAVRQHLGMEIAYLSEFVDDRSVFRAVETGGRPGPVAPGDSIPLNEVYCMHIVEGRLPRLIPDTAAEPLAMSMPITKNVPIGSHASIPILRDDGQVYGMFCCLSTRPNATLNDRDLEIMEVFANLASEQVNGAVREKTRFDALRAAVRRVLVEQDFEIKLQPIVDMTTRRTTGFEALCRFGPEPYRSPDRWFADAEETGLLVELELAVIAAALELLPRLPADVYLSVNASPATVASGRLGEVFDPHPKERIVLEVTEHLAVENYDALVEETTRWRYRGVKLAVDDAGAGYSGLQQIARLHPDIVKLDMALTKGIDTDTAKRSLAAAMVHYAKETASLIVAEGIETEAERAVLEGLGVHRGQGWHFGRPEPLARALAFCCPARLGDCA